MSALAGTRHGTRWVRVGIAALVIGLLAVVLLTTEVALLAVVATGLLRLGGAVVTTLGAGPVTGLVAATLGCLSVFWVVGAVHRAASRSDDGFEFAPQLLTYAYVALFGASVWLAWTLFRRLSVPQWAQILVGILAIASFYPALAYKLQQLDVETEIETETDPFWRESSDTDDESASEHISTFEGREHGRDLATGAAFLRAVWRTGTAPIRDLTRRAGWLGPLCLGAVALVALGSLWLAARRGDTAALYRPVAVAVALLATSAHVGGDLHAELMESTILAELDERFDRDRPAGGRTDTGTTSGPSNADATGSSSGTSDDTGGPSVEARLTRLAGQASVPTPDLRILDTRRPVAATVGYRVSDATVVVSTGLVDALDEAELEAVLAHEVAHVANRDAAVLTALSFPRVAARRVFQQYTLNPLLVVFALVTGTTSRLCVAVVARAREYAADDGAVAITGDPAALASALATLDDTVDRQTTADLRAVAAFSIVPPAWEPHRFFDRTRRLVQRGLFGTHPSTSERIERLHERTREFERET
ncbi:M48 family metallopeptidase [Halobaculum sp. MBLA0147]|uniref:M48 family metallopeptidase n=1 Tax=Halobaculum sp. MBLA0147 TaxID=3079934 RepID=UPI003526A5D2